MADKRNEKVLQSFEEIDMQHDFKKQVDLNFNSLYEQCNKEMGFQQSKRDQTIAFYIAIISFLVPAVIDLELASVLFAVVYGVLWLVGWILSGVVRRYRIYKECYWLNLRTLSTIQRVEPDRLNKDAFQRVFAATMRMNRPNVVVAKDENTVPASKDVTLQWLQSQKKDYYKTQINYYKTWKKNTSSAEYLLYMLIVIISSLMMAMAVFYAGTWLLGYVAAGWAGTQLTCIGLGVAAAGLCVYIGASKYICDLAAVYAYCFDYQKASFNRPYTKAWFLHCFNSELEPEKKEKEKAASCSK